MNKILLQRKKKGTNNPIAMPFPVINVFIGLTFILCLTFSVNASSQVVRGWDIALSEMQQSPDEEIRLEGKHLEKLANGLNPTVYIKKEGIKAFGRKSPVCAYLNTQDAGKLYGENPLFGSVELITIVLTEKEGLSASLDLSALQGFKQLKYILVRSDFECTPAQIQNMFTGANEGIRICYLVSFPG